MLFAVAGTAQAGRPLSTEDASILEARACQLEAWVDRSREATDLWVVPACSVGGIEWQAGGMRQFAAGTSYLEQAYAQAKTAFVPVDDNPWGVGLVLGVVRNPRREAQTGWGDPYVIVPLSFRLGEGGTLLHLNAGTVRNREEGRNLTLWGVAVEVPATEKLTLVGESYGENRSKPFFRLGGRWSVAEGFDIDLTVVTRSGGTSAERFVSLGLYYKADSILP
jgi:hypothetical protein